MFGRKMHCVVLALVGSFLFFSLKESPGQDLPGEGDVIKIGVAGPLTGGQSKMGSDVLNGAQLAVDEWNERGGVLGRKIVIVKQDDEANEQLARSVANTLVNERVVGVIGHFNSGCMIPASDVYKEAGIPVITPSATNPYVTDRGYFNVFRVCGRDDVQGQVAAEYVVDVLGCRRIAVLHDKTAYGEGLARYFKETVEKKLGKEAIVYYGGFSNKESNFRPFLTAMAAENPEIYFFGGIYDQAGPLVVQAKDMGITIPLVSGDGVIDPEFLKTAREHAEGTFLTFADFLPFAPDYEKYPEARKFTERYEEKFGTPGPYSLYAYDATNILLAGIQMAGSTDGRKISDAIRNTEHSTALGKIRFDEKGDIAGSFYIMWEVKDGAFVRADMTPRRLHNVPGKSAAAIAIPWYFPVGGVIVLVLVVLLILRARKRAM